MFQKCILALPTPGVLLFAGENDGIGQIGKQIVPVVFRERAAGEAAVAGDLCGDTLTDFAFTLVVDEKGKVVISAKKLEEAVENFPFFVGDDGYIYQKE